MDDKEIIKTALEFAKKNKKRIAKELTNPSIYIPSSRPVSIFMAGSPGAGKTEFSKNLIAILEKHFQENAGHGLSRAIRIDGDDIRSLIPNYAGGNSHLFQSAVSIIVEKMHDYVLQREQNFILDGTFSKYDKARENITRSLEKRRRVFIYYLYQKAEIAWRFTQAREKAEGRNILKPAFIDQFLGAYDTINRIRKDFGKEVVIFLIKKDFEKNTVESLIELEPKESIDEGVFHKYNKNDLEKLLL